MNRGGASCCVPALRRPVVVAAAVFALTALVYSPSRNFSFLRYDDKDYVVCNGAIREGLTPAAVRWAFTDIGYASNWHPLTWLSHEADVTVAKALGLSWETADCEKTGRCCDFECSLARFAHVHNVILHAVNATLLFILLLMALDGRTGSDGPLFAAFLALLWALHPLRVEVACWVSERKELLSVMFMLLTMICWVRRGRILLSLFFFSLALLSKPVAVTLPAVLLAYDWCVRRDAFRTAFLRVVPFAVLSAAAMALTLAAQTVALRSGGTIPPLLRVFCSLDAPAVYLAQTVWPFGLTVDYFVPTLADWGWHLAGLAVIAAVAAAVVLWLVRPGAWTGIGAFAVAWTYVGLLPMLGIVKVGVQPHSDRYTYWIGCGVAVTLALVAARLGPAVWARVPRGCAKAGFLVLAILSVLTFVQESHWRDTEALLGRAVGFVHNEETSYVLALDLMCRNRYGRAEEILRETLAARRSAVAEGNLALFLAVCESEDVVRSVSEIELLSQYALAADPACKTALAAKAFLAYRSGRKGEALEWMEKAIAAGYDPQVVDISDWWPSAGTAHGGGKGK